MEQVQKANWNVYASNDGRYHYDDDLPLGKGAFGVVLKARDRQQNDETVAVKIVEAQKSVKELLFRQKPAAGKAAQKEARLLVDLKHKNIVVIRDHFKLKSEMFSRKFGFAIVMEYCPENLEARLGKLQQENTRLSKQARIQWYQQLAGALEYIHSQEVVHRDLKPANILIDANDNLKIADVGLAKALCEGMTLGGSSEQQYMETVAGTRPFMAPEVWNEHYTINSDVFSMGMVMFIICELPDGLVPYVLSSGACLGLHMHRTSSVQRMSATLLLNACKCDGDEKKLFDDMLQYNYHERPTAAQVCKQLCIMEKNRLEEERRREQEKRRREEERRREERRREEERKRAEERRQEQQTWWGWFKSFFH